MIVGKMVDNMTRGSCISTDSVKSGDDHSNLIHILGWDIYWFGYDQSSILDWLKLWNAWLVLSEKEVGM